MNNPLVCICIPHYNNENTISDTLDSILNQTYKNIKVKIFDNVSTDNSLQIIQDYASRYSNLEVFQNETNLGGEGNFSKCIEGLEGQFGAIYHADDIYHPNMVETQVKYLLENDISAIFVRANLIDDNSNNIGEQFFPDEFKNNNYYQFNFEQLFSLILKYDNFLITPSVMADVTIYKNLIKSWNGEQFKTSADLDVWLRFSEIKDIGIITEKLISYRMSTASFSYRTKFSRIIPRDMFLIIDYYLDKYSNVIFDKADYEFLKFKDNVLVLCNKILNNLTVNSKDIKLMKPNVIIKALFSKQKLKIYIYAVIIKILLFLNSKKLLLNLIKKVMRYK